MAITAKDVQKLRGMTGVGMMDCKKALTEADGDFDKACEVLREKGLAAAAKKAGRIAADGMCYAFVNEDCTESTIVEVNSETDFVAKNEEFQSLVKGVAEAVAINKPADIEALKLCMFPGTSMTITEVMQEKILKIGENMQLRRFDAFKGKYNGCYIHMNGSKAVIANFDVLGIATKDNADLARVAKDVCMQIVAMRPQYVSRDDVPDEVVEKEKEFQIHQTMQEGKPQAIAEKIVVGRINKFFEEICVVDQAFIKDDKEKVGKYIERRAKEMGGTMKLLGFVCYEKGEGIEKRQDDFATEVANMIK